MNPTKKPLLGVRSYNQKRVTRQGESRHFSSRANFLFLNQTVGQVWYKNESFLAQESSGLRVTVSQKPIFFLCFFIIYYYLVKRTCEILLE